MNLLQMAIPALLPEAYTVLSIGGVALGLLALAAGVGALRRAGRLEAHYRALMQDVDGRDLASALERFTARLDAAEAELHRLRQHTSGLDDYAGRTGRSEQAIAGLRARLGDVDARLRRAVQHVRIVRFGAFEDVGGDQSFALAMLDDRGDGVVLSGLHHRNGVRIYAKPLAAKRSTYTLTAEEERILADIHPAEPAG